MNWHLSLVGKSGASVGGCPAKSPRDALSALRDIERHDQRAVRVVISGPRCVEQWDRDASGAFVFTRNGVEPWGGEAVAS